MGGDMDLFFVYFMISYSLQPLSRLIPRSYFTTFSSISIVDFKQLNVNRVEIITQQFLNYLVRINQ